MYQKMKKMVFHTLIPAVLMAAMLPMTVCAAGNGGKVSIPVKVNMTGDTAPAEEQAYSIVLEAVTEGAPMPETAEGALLKFPSAGGELKFGEITYTVPDDYEYRIYQTTADKEHYVFDKTVYNFVVRVTNENDGNLNAVLFVKNEASGETKLGEIAFTNSYDKPYTPGGGGDSGGDNPDGGGGNPPGDGLTTINDPGVPLGPGDFFTEILPEDVPLAMLPKTGDTTNLMLWTVLAALSAGGLILLMAYRKREEK